MRHTPGVTEQAARDTQREYYRRTAERYDADHVQSRDEHADSLQLISAFLPMLGARSVLDTGCGTGRGLRTLQKRFPDMILRGNDPSEALLQVAVERHGLPRESLSRRGTLELDDPAGSHDIVMSLGVLHHVPDPRAVICKMLDLAAKAIFISDSNYLGQGRFPVRFLKLALSKAKLWRAVKYVQQGFRSWAYSEGDGVYYSYSVFNDLDLVRERCRQVLIMPVGARAAWAVEWPKLLAQTVLVCGIK